MNLSNANIINLSLQKKCYQFDEIIGLVKIPNN